MNKKMKALIIYCHPSEDSNTKLVCDSFIQGVVDSGNEYEISDLYKLNFISNMSEKEYLRDVYYKNTPELANDVLLEQKKINESDAIVFIYPLFWTDVPGKLKGWFDRVWSYGFAYGERTMKKLRKGLILCIAGHSIEHLEKFGFLQSIKNIMIGDRLSDRVKTSEFVIYDKTTKGSLKAGRSKQHQDDAYIRGKKLFDNKKQNIQLDGKCFTLMENSTSGEVNGETVFLYHQKDDIVWAEYQGGKILKGSLVGRIEKLELNFSYQHLNTEKEIKTGKCKSIIQVMENSKLRLIESWQWSTGEEGESIIQEI